MWQTYNVGKWKDMCVYTHIHTCYLYMHTYIYICFFLKKKSGRMNQKLLKKKKSWFSMGKEETGIGIKVRFSEYTLFYSYDFGTTYLYNTKHF